MFAKVFLQLFFYVYILQPEISTEMMRLLYVIFRLAIMIFNWIQILFSLKDGMSW